MVTQKEFERARDDILYRNSFINEIGLDGARKYVKSVVYEPRVEVYSLDGIPAAMQCYPPLRACFGLRGGKSKITVFPRAFSSGVHLCLDDFLSTLIDHEILGHAKLYFEGVDPFSPTEVGVMYQHLERLRERNCSEQYRNTIVTELENFLTGVRKIR